MTVTVAQIHEDPAILDRAIASQVKPQGTDTFLRLQEPVSLRLWDGCEIFLPFTGSSRFILPGE